MNESLVITKKFQESEFRGILTDEHVCQGDSIFPVKALWDTGSYESVISSDLVKKIKPRSIGVSHVSSTGAATKSRVYEVDVLLGNKIRIPLQVTESKVLSNNHIDMLIGMDVIGVGDFSVSTYNGVTCFSFRHPSQGLIDFKEQEN